MTVEILTSIMFAPYHIDQGDIVVVTEHSTVRSLISDCSQISITIDGIVSNGNYHSVGQNFYGIYINGGPTDEDGDANGYNMVHVRDGGFVHGEIAIELGEQQYDTVVVSGRVFGNEIGVSSDGDYLTLNVTGSIVCKADGYERKSAVSLSGDFATVNNSGRLIGQETGLEFNNSDGSIVNNFGKIQGGTSGVSVAGSDFSLINLGSIYSTDHRTGLGVGVAWSEGFVIENTGQIKGNTGIGVTGSSGEIINNGLISGQRIGIEVNVLSSELGGQIDISNSGTIESETAVSVQDGTAYISNTGEIWGHIHAGGADGVTLHNSGLIKGAVKLSNDNDIYRIIGDGETRNPVDGQSGNDLLVGGARGETLRGGRDDDILFGKGGADFLSGGTGEDILKGGANNDTLLGDKGNDILYGGHGADVIEGGEGNDTLTGGHGKDIFVFGLWSDTNTVTDFVSGVDSLRITRHVGGFETLAVTDQGDNVEVIYDSGKIVLLDVFGLHLSAADFEFL